MRTTVWLVLASIGFGSTGCDALGLSGGEIRVRVENDTGQTLEDLVLYPGGADSIVVATMAPGQTTPFQVVPIAYRLATVAARIGTTPDRIQVIDHVGEKSLESGDYTYVIGLNRLLAIPRLTQTLRRD